MDMDPEKFDSDKSMANWLNKSTRALSTRLQNVFTKSGFDVTAEQWMLLLILWQKDGRFAFQMADIISKDRAAVTRLLDGLEKRKLIVRKKNHLDSRHKEIYLTPKGKALKDELIPIGVANMQKALDGLSKEEIESTLAVLRKIYRNLTG